MNAHQRRVTERAKNLDGFKAHRAALREQAPTFWPQVVGRGKRSEIHSNTVETIMRAEGVQLKIKAEPMKPETIAALDADAAAKGHTAHLSREPQPAGFVFIEGGSVRNTRTKSVATMIDDGRFYGRDEIWVHRGDNRKVWWPLSECENWNL